MADDWGLQAQNVSRERQRLGILSYKERHLHTRWSRRQIAKLGTVPDCRLAEQMGISLTVVAAKRRELGIPSYAERQQQNRWRPEMQQVLGSLPDAWLARRWGLSYAMVNNQRRRMGIPAFDPYRVQVTERLLDELAGLPLDEVIERTGYTHAALRKVARARGITIQGGTRPSPSGRGRRR